MAKGFRQDYGRPFEDRSAYGPDAVAGPHSGVHPGASRADMQTPYRQEYPHDDGWVDHGGRTLWDRAADEVSSWFRDEAAQARRQEDRRVRGPRNHSRSDERILEDVNDRLNDDPDLDVTDIRASLSGREVSPDGEVDVRLGSRTRPEQPENQGGLTALRSAFALPARHGDRRPTPRRRLP